MGIELPRYSKCCYCIPLKIGVLIIGYISIFASCMTLGTISYSIFKVSEFVKNNNNKPHPEHPPKEVSNAALGLYLSFAYYLLVFLFSFAISLILLIGTHAVSTLRWMNPQLLPAKFKFSYVFCYLQGKPSYLRFYFKATMFLFALSIVLVVVTAVFMGFLATLPVLKWSFTLLVCMIMVRSYYLILEEGEKPPVYELQPYVPVQQGQQAPLMA